VFIKGNEIILINPTYSICSISFVVVYHLPHRLIVCKSINSFSSSVELPEKEIMTQKGIFRHGLF